MYFCAGFSYSCTHTLESNDTDSLEQELCKLAGAVESKDKLRERKHELFFLRDEVDVAFLAGMFGDMYPYDTRDGTELEYLFLKMVRFFLVSGLCAAFLFSIVSLRDVEPGMEVRPISFPLRISS